LILPHASEIVLNVSEIVLNKGHAALAFSTVGIQHNLAHRAIFRD
jgi:hypothetical protein